MDNFNADIDLETSAIHRPPPMFALDQVQFSFPGELSCLCVANNWLAIVLNRGRTGGSEVLLLIDLSQSQTIDEIEVQMRQKNDHVCRVFLDPLAQHLILSTEMGDIFYLQKSWKKPKHLSKMRGVVIESIGWGLSTTTSTGVILIGSKKGYIFEAELSWPDEFSKKDFFFKQIFSLYDDNTPVIGISILRHRDTSRASVAVCTADHLFQFTGALDNIASESGCYGSLFNSTEAQDVHDIPRGSDGFGQVSAWSASKNEVKLSWLTAIGIYSGSFQTGGSKMTPFSLIPFPPGCFPSEQDAMLQLVQTEFHFVLLYQNSVKAVSESTGEMVYEEKIPLDVNERVLGMVHDPIKHTYWIWTNKVLYELIVTEEDRHMWSFYLQQNNYDKALHHAKTKAQRDQIWVKQANSLFRAGKLKEAAELFAQSETISFEDAGLQLIDTGDVVALKTFLLKKLTVLPSTALVQISTIATWLVDVFISILNGTQDSPSTSDNENLQEFYQFLRMFKDNVDLKTVYSLLRSNGRTQDYLFLADLIGDKDSVIHYWIQEEKWHSALSVLAQMDSPKLYYKYSSELLQSAPAETVNLWIRNSNLNPRHLLPALIKYNSHSVESQTHGKVSQNHAIRYLLHIIESKGSTDIVVHNYILYLFAMYAKSDRQESLLRFLKSQKEAPIFDPRYALRVCTYHNLPESCILIYSLMGLHEQAVDLALRIHDIELAQIQADQPEDDDSLRKRLWLRIANHVVAEKNDVHQAVEFIKKSDLLKFEDILPLFSDFVHIDVFKEELSHCLNEYKDKLDELTEDMNEATLSAEHIRSEIKSFKNRYTVLSSSEQCSLCHTTLMTRQFYVFPCGHFFHLDCTVDETMKTCSSYKRKKIEMLLSLISSSGSKALDVKNQLDALCAEQCLLCGDAMIKSIGISLLDNVQNEFEMWEI